MGAEFLRSHLAWCQHPDGARWGAHTCWLGNWHSTEVMLLAYWAITLRTDFSTEAGMRPDTLVMISCSSSSGSDGCRRVTMSFCTHSFSCSSDHSISLRPCRGTGTTTHHRLSDTLNPSRQVRSSSSRSGPSRLWNGPEWNGPLTTRGIPSLPTQEGPSLPSAYIQKANVVWG